MNNIFINLENGNLTAAKKMAVRHSFQKLITLAENDGYSGAQAINIVQYLKNKISFQKYCDNCLDIQQGKIV
jgi:hypothetical protein